LLAGAASAQPSDATIKPIMFMHDGPDDPTTTLWPSAWRDYFPPALNVNVQAFSSPSAAAAELARQMRVALDAAPTGTTPPFRIAFLLQNFAHEDAAGSDANFNRVALLRADDAFVAPDSGTGWPNGWIETDPGVQDTRKNPWMTNARAEMASWSADFAAEFNAVRNQSPYNLGTRYPDRLAQDMEVKNYPQGNKNYLQAVLQMCSTAGSGLHTNGLNRYQHAPVPGFGGQTLEDLWLAYAPVFNTSTERSLFLSAHCSPACSTQQQGDACLDFAASPTAANTADPNAPDGASDSLNRKYINW
jgi:hypothetical protein